MKITPIEIRQKQFDKRTLGGIDRDQVDAFLLTVSQAYEKQLEENHQLKERLTSTERELSKLREIEATLHKTLKTAEETGANMVEQARTQATLQVRESELKAETILKEARWQAKFVIDEARQEARRTYERLQDDVAKLHDEARQTERTRDGLLAELHALATEVADKVLRHQARSRSINFEEAQAIRQPEVVLSPTLEAALADTQMQGPAQAMPEANPQASASFFDAL